MLDVHLKRTSRENYPDFFCIITFKVLVLYIIQSYLRPLNPVF